MVYERLLQCMWRGMRGFDFSGIHAGMPLLFSGDLSGGTAVGRFRTGFFWNGRARIFFLSWWWGGDAYLTEEEKLEAVKSIFAKREKRFPEEARTARREYIREVFPEWEDYLRGR